METLDVLIIGGGPTGLNCAISVAQAGLSYRVIEKGVLVNSIYHFPTNMTFFSTSKLLEIGNTPFVSHGEKPTRREALEYYRRLLQAFDLQVNTFEAVQRMERLPEGSYRIDSDKRSYLARTVIVATGFYDTPRLLGVPGEDLPKVKHYYDEAHPYVGQDVLVIGAANSACQVSLELFRKGARVTMAIRDDKIYKGVKYWIKPDITNRIAEGSITAHFSTEVREITPDSVVLDGPDGRFTIANDWVMAMTGYQPNYDLLHRLGIAISDDALQLPVHDPETLETNLPGVYLAGVVCAGRQTSKLFIENTREHGEIIVNQIKQQLALA